MHRTHVGIEYFTKQRTIDQNKSITVKQYWLTITVSSKPQHLWIEFHAENVRQIGREDADDERRRRMQYVEQCDRQRRHNRVRPREWV